MVKSVGSIVKVLPGDSKVAGAAVTVAQIVGCEGLEETREMARHLIESKSSLVDRLLQDDLDVIKEWHGLVDKMGEEDFLPDMKPGEVLKALTRADMKRESMVLMFRIFEDGSVWIDFKDGSDADYESVEDAEDHGFYGDDAMIFVDEQWGHLP